MEFNGATPEVDLFTLVLGKEPPLKEVTQPRDTVVAPTGRTMSPHQKFVKYIAAGQLVNKHFLNDLDLCHIIGSGI